MRLAVVQLSDEPHDVAANLLTSLRLLQEASDGGAELAVFPELALTGSDVMPHYCAAKGAIIGLTRSLALELAPAVRVNAVAPGPTDTPLLTDLWRSPEYLATLPVRRLCEPEEIAEAIAFLAGDGGSYFTGQVVSPNAGAVI